MSIKTLHTAIIIFTTFVLIIFFGCKNQVFDSNEDAEKELFSPAKNLFSFFTAYLNGEFYDGNSDAELKPSGTLVIWGVRKHKRRSFDEDITFEIQEFNGRGVYSFDKISFAVYRKNAGDIPVFCASANWTDSEANQVIINYYNKHNNIIEGTVSLDLATEAKEMYQVRDGHFRAFIRE